MSIDPMDAYLTRIREVAERLESARLSDVDRKIMLDWLGARYPDVVDSALDYLAGQRRLIVDPETARAAREELTRRIKVGPILRPATPDPVPDVPELPVRDPQVTYFCLACADGLGSVHSEWCPKYRAPEKCPNCADGYDCQSGVYTQAGEEAS